MRTDILVTHPYKHHALNLAAGCLQSGMSTAFALPFYRTGLGAAVALAPGSIGRKASSYHHPGLDGVRLIQSPLWQVRKLLSFLGNPRRIEAPYDEYVASRLLRGKWRAKIVVTLQDHMPLTSAAAKQVGAVLWSDQIINLSDDAMARIRAHSLGNVPDHSEHANTKILSMADIVTVPSAYTLDGIKDRVAPTARIHCIPYGVDARRFELPRTQQDDCFTIVARANSVRKGGHLMLAAVLRSHQQWSALVHPRRLRIVFLGGFEPALAEQYARVKQLKTISVQQGNIPSNDVPGLFANADLFLMPTLSESMSLACLEAMRAGLPLLITEYAGVDCFVDGEMGLLIEDSIDSIESAVSAALSQPARLDRWRQAVRMAAQSMDWNRYEKAIAAVPREAHDLLERRRRA